MCGQCLSRRSFHKGLLSATLAPGCLSRPGLVEPHMRLAVAAEAPRTVALTLDACGGATDMRIVQVLLDQAVPVTIFATALWLRGNGKVAEAMRTRPDMFSVQNHGERHLPPVLGSRPVYGLVPAGTLDAIRREVERGAAAVEAAGFPRPMWYRGATALYSPAALGLIEGMGFKVAGFSVNGDEGASSPASVVTHRYANAVSGSVIISHVNQPNRPSGAGVAAGVEMLLAAGVRFVTLDAETVSADECRTDRSAIQIRFRWPGQSVDA